MRTNLSRTIEAQIRNLVVQGDLAPGSRINEVHLASSLEVSRTPLREALTRLVGATFLEAKPRHGFFVRTVSVAELEQLYAIRQQLDPWALTLAGQPTPEHLQDLRELNTQFASATENSLQAIEIDDQWHLCLLRECNNAVLLELIEQMMFRTRSYEYVYFSQADAVVLAAREHQRIIDALAIGDLSTAAVVLKENMTSATEPVIAWIEQTTIDNA